MLSLWPRMKLTCRHASSQNLQMFRAPLRCRSDCLCAEGQTDPFEGQQALVPSLYTGPIPLKNSNISTQNAFWASVNVLLFLGTRGAGEAETGPRGLKLNTMLVLNSHIQPRAIHACAHRLWLTASRSFRVTALHRAAHGPPAAAGDHKSDSKQVVILGLTTSAATKPGFRR